MKTEKGKNILMIFFKSGFLKLWKDRILKIPQNHYEVPFHTSQNGCDPKVYK